MEENPEGLVEAIAADSRFRAVLEQQPRRMRRMTLKAACELHRSAIGLVEAAQRETEGPADTERSA